MEDKGCIICHGKIGDCECVQGWLPYFSFLYDLLKSS